MSSTSLQAQSAFECILPFTSSNILARGKEKRKEWSIGFTPQQFFQPFVVKEL